MGIGGITGNIENPLLNKIGQITKTASETISEDTKSRFAKSLLRHMGNISRRKGEMEQALGAVGIGVGTALAMGVLSTSCPPAAGILLAVIGGCVLFAGAYKAWENVKAENPNASFGQRSAKFVKHSVENIIFGSAKIIINCSSTLQQKVEHYANRTTKTNLAQSVNTARENLNKLQSTASDIQNQIGEIKQEINIAKETATIQLETLKNNLTQLIYPKNTQKPTKETLQKFIQNNLQEINSNNVKNLLSLVDKYNSNPNDTSTLNLLEMRLTQFLQKEIQNQLNQAIEDQLNKLKKTIQPFQDAMENIQTACKDLADNPKLEDFKSNINTAGNNIAKAANELNQNFQTMQENILEKIKNAFTSSSLESIDIQDSDLNISLPDTYQIEEQVKDICNKCEAQIKQKLHNQIENTLKPLLNQNNTNE